MRAPAGESIGRPTSAFSVVLSTGGGSEEGGTPRGLLSPTLKSMRHSESMLHMQPLWEENPHIWQVRSGRPESINHCAPAFLPSYTLLAQRLCFRRCRAADAYMKA